MVGYFKEMFGGGVIAVMNLLSELRPNFKKIQKVLYVWSGLSALYPSFFVKYKQWTGACGEQYKFAFVGMKKRF